jgi:hypothetical protein
MNCTLQLSMYATDVCCFSSFPYETLHASHTTRKPSGVHGCVHARVSECNMQHGALRPTAHRVRTVPCTRVHTRMRRTARTEGYSEWPQRQRADGGCLLTSGGSDIAESAVTFHSFGKARRARTEERGGHTWWRESNGRPNCQLLAQVSIPFPVRVESIGRTQLSSEYALE